MNPREDFIILSTQLVKQLSEDELEAVIAHELCYIKTDIEEVTKPAIGFSRYLAEYPLLVSLIPLIYISSYFFLGFFSREAYFPYFFVDLMFICAVYLMAYLLAVSINFNASFGSFYPHLRELDADVTFSLVTRKPKALISAPKTIILMKIVDAKFPSLQFYGRPSKKKVRIKRWIDLFHAEPWIAPPWITYIHPSPLKRVKLLKLLDKMRNKSISLKIRKSLRSFSALKIYWPNFLLLWSPRGKRLKKMRKDEIKAVYDYISSNKDNFNLLECAKSLGMKEINVASTFISFLMRGVVDIVNPSS